MVLRKPCNKNKYVKIGTYNFEVVQDYIQDYTYLSTVLGNKTELTRKNEKRISNANVAYYGVLRRQLVLGAAKIKVFKTVTRSVETQTAASWKYNKDITRRLFF